MCRFFSVSALFLAALSPLALAQKPDAAPVTPAQQSIARDAPLDPALPALFIVGDSTARNNADLGWGDHLAHFFDTNRINIANRAVAGRSSRTYINEGRWAGVLAEMKSGDFLLLQMGHNDGGSDAQGVVKDAKGRASIHALGDATVDVPIAKPVSTGPLAGLSTETVHTYGWYMHKMVAEARARGVHPALLTLTVRNIWKTEADGSPRIERDMGFTALIRQIAGQEHIPVIDMSTLAADTFEARGEACTATLFPIDHTHTSALGAEINAESVARALVLAKSPLAAYEIGH